jgi:hypothetical protein
MFFWLGAMKRFVTWPDLYGPNMLPTEILHPLKTGCRDDVFTVLHVRERRTIRTWSDINETRVEELILEYECDRVTICDPSSVLELPF